MYDIFVIDPPWNQKKNIRAVRPNQTRALDYSTLPVKEIFSLLDDQIFPLGNPEHTVFMWMIDKYLVEAEQEMEQRGYRRHARLIWDKRNGVAPAFTVRFSHEYLVWFYKGKFMPVSKEQRGKLTTVFYAKPREHSRKPDESYELIDLLYPDKTKIDVFSRENRQGWDVWGDQTGYFEEINETANEI